MLTFFNVLVPMSKFITLWNYITVTSYFSGTKWNSSQWFVGRVLVRKQGFCWEKNSDSLKPKIRGNVIIHLFSRWRWVVPFYLRTSLDCCSPAGGVCSIPVSPSTLRLFPGPFLENARTSVIMETVINSTIIIFRLYDNNSSYLLEVKRI